MAKLLSLLLLTFLLYVSSADDVLDVMSETGDTSALSVKPTQAKNNAVNAIPEQKDNAVGKLDRWRQANMCRKETYICLNRCPRKCESLSDPCLPRATGCTQKCCCGIISLAEKICRPG